MAMPRTGIDPVTEPPAGRRGLSLAALLRGGAVRWRVAAALGLVCGAALAAAAYAAYPAEYTATGMLQFRFNDALIADDRGGRGGKEDLENQQRMHSALIRTWQVLDAANKSDPLVFPPARLAKDLKVGFSEGTPLMSVSLTGLERDALARSVNAVAEAFERATVDADRTELQDKAQQLDRAISDSGESILKKKSDLRRLTDGRAEDPRVKAAEADLLATSTELTRTQLEIEKRQGAIDRAKTKLATVEKDPIERSALEDLLDQLPLVAEAQAALTKLEAAEADLRRRFTSPDEPPVRQAADKAVRQREALQKLKTDLGPRVEAQVRRRLKADLLAAVGKDEEEVATLKLVEASLRKKRDAGAATAATGLPPSMEMQFKAIEQDEDVLKALRTRRERLRVELQSGGSKIRVVQRAVPPDQPQYRSQYMKTAAAGLAGLALGWLGVGWLEVRSRRVRDGRAIAAHTGLRLLGAIPAGVPAGVGLLKPADMALAIATDLLRTNLQLDDRLQACRTLAVTSAAEAEGKSTLAVLLAGSLARAGFRTLLVDADFLNPCLGDRLGVPAESGLSDSLAVDAYLAPKNNLAGFDGLPLGLMQAGTSGPAAAARLARADLQGFFKSLRQNWEYIIIDAPPILPVPDAAFVAKAADGVVLCARAGFSKSEDVHAAVDHMAGLGIDCLGIVLNEVRAGRPLGYGTGLGRAEPILLKSAPQAPAGGDA